MYTSSMKTREDIVAVLHQAFGLPVNVVPTVSLLQLRRRLIEEEVQELFLEIDTAINALEQGSDVPPEVYAAMLKELADVQFVLSGMAVTLQPLQKLQEAFERVHSSNMSKLGDDGKPLYREDGKFLKGPNYIPADVSDLVV